MPLVLDIDDAVPVLSSPDGLAVNDDVLLGADDGKRDHVLSSSDLRNNTDGWGV
jgi:hypothetical protein